MPVPSISTKDGFALRMSTNDSANYDWPTDPPSLRHVPYFQTIPLQLEDLVRDSSRGDTLNLDGLLFLPDGSRHWSVSRQGPATEAERIGREAGAVLKDAAGDTYARHLQ